MDRWKQKMMKKELKRRNDLGVAINEGLHGCVQQYNDGDLKKLSIILYYFNHGEMKYKEPQINKLSGP